jgi:hypothetical protein
MLGEGDAVNAEVSGEVEEESYAGWREETIPQDIHQSKLCNAQQHLTAKRTTIILTFQLMATIN